MHRGAQESNRGGADFISQKTKVRRCWAFSKREFLDAIRVTRKDSETEYYTEPVTPLTGDRRVLEVTPIDRIELYMSLDASARKSSAVVTFYLKGTRATKQSCGDGR